MTTPTDRDVADTAAAYGFTFADDEAHATFVELVQTWFAGAEGIADLPDAPTEVAYPRSEWHHPDPSDNPLNAWYVRTNIEGASGGKLSGRTVAIKDNIFVADVPMMDGTRILEGYVPPIDATVVTRLLDEGATIIGKSVCEAYCFSAGSHISESGDVLNPIDNERSAGGSSSGSAALVASGAVDMAMGGDQGGSIRVPCSYCGIVGLKPTHGLVPYTGILGMDPSIDHTGPMTTTVADSALMLEVIAGPDGIDGRQYGHEAQPYTDAVDAGVSGMKIGILTEAFGYENSEPDVDTKVRAAAERLGKLGAEVADISVPMHLEAGIVSAAFIQGIIDNMFINDGLALGRTEPVVESFFDVQHTWRDRPNDLPEAVKVFRHVVCAAKARHRRQVHGESHQPNSPAKSRVRRCPGAGRSDVDADHVHEVDGATAQGCTAKRDHGQVLRVAHQHVAVQHDPTSCDLDPVWDERGPACRADARRSSLRRDEHLQGCRRLRGARRLENVVGLWATYAS